MGLCHHHRAWRLDNFASVEKKSRMMNFRRLSLLIWAVLAGVLITSWIGSTRLLSGTFHIENITFAANVIFIFTTVLAAILLHLVLPKVMPKKIAVITFLLPLLVLLALLV